MASNKTKGIRLIPVAPPMITNTRYMHWHPYGWRSKVRYWLAVRLLRNAWFEIEPDRYTEITTGVKHDV